MIKISSSGPPTFQDRGIFNFIFLRWVKFWLITINKGSVDYSMLPPIPYSDRISYWYPIFSKHISDGLLLIEDEDIARFVSVGSIKGRKKHRRVKAVLRAVIYTFWRRALLIILGTIVINLVSFSSPIFLDKLLKMLSSNSDRLGFIIFLVLCISLLEAFQTLVEQHIFFYNSRLYNIIAYSLAITMFEHGLCCRRNYFTPLDPIGPEKWCRNIYHGFSSGAGNCCNVKLYCPASRYQNAELTKSIYTYLLIDSDYAAYILDPIIRIVKTVTSITFGIFLINHQMGMDVLKPAIITLCLILLMIVSEIIGGFLLKHHLAIKDYRISNTSDIIGGLRLLTIAGVDDIGYNKICECRGSEISILRKRLFFYFSNVGINRVINTVISLVIILDFIDIMKQKTIDTSFNITAPITILYTISKIVSSLNELPKILRIGFLSLRGFQRMEEFMRHCSPNHYLIDKTDKSQVNDSNIVDFNKDNINSELSDNIVLFKDASFAYIFDRTDLLDRTSKSTILSNCNFRLGRGDIVIVTGDTGSGKTSFIKAILGEMSLIGGNIAVIPLSIGMPIFYASQDIWFPSGTIRSIIMFDYDFDSDIYDVVIKATELVSDISSWNGGDERLLSEQGYTLSGGQRARLALARALYAYMIHSKYNDGHCYLMCLDDSLNGLDPTVLKNVFTNLFHKETGLLIKEDVSVVLTMNKMVFDICLSSDYVSDAVCSSVYGMADNELSKFDTSNDDVKAKNINMMTENFQNLRKDGAFANGVLMPYKSPFSHYKQFNSTLIRTNFVSDFKEKFVDSENVDYTKNSNLRTAMAYKTYFKAIGYICSSSFILMFLASTIMENVISLLIADWSDKIKNILGLSNKLNRDSDMIAQHLSTSKVLTILSIAVIITTFVGVYLLLLGSINASKTIHNYVINSIFQKNEVELEIKKTLSMVVSFLMADIFFLDECTSVYYVTTIFSLFDIIIRFVIVVYSLPIIFPVIFIAMIITLCCVFYRFVIGSRNVQTMLLDSYSRIYSVYGDVIAGGPYFRCYRKEHECIDSIIRLSNSHYSINFMKVSITAWSQITSKVIICVLIPFVALIPIVQRAITGSELHVAHLGLGISMFISFNNSLAELMDRYAIIEHVMSCVTRFNSFFLGINGASLNEKFDKMDEMILSEKLTHSLSESDKSGKNNKNCITRRRINYFRNVPSNKYRSYITKIFYKPKIDFVEINNYLPHDHVSVELKDVTVLQPSHEDDVSTNYILNGITSSAYASEIVGLIGRTGSGKSTILHALQNIVNGRTGSVLLDGIELNLLPKRLLRQIIGVLPQLPFIFKGWTVRRFVDPRMLYSDDDIITSLDICGLLDIIKDLSGEKFLDTVLVYDALILPGKFFPSISTDSLDQKKTNITNDSILTVTQMRKLSFARLLLYRNMYRLLLVDEPPSESAQNIVDTSDMDIKSSIDTNDSVSIYDLIRIYFKHCTTFLVTHDSNVINSCTSIWVIADGKIAKKYNVEDLKSQDTTVSIDSLI